MKSYDKNNIFAKILRGDLPCDKVYEDKDVLAFQDKYPKADVHILVIPRLEYICFDDFIEKASTAQICNFFKIVKHIANEQSLSDYRLVTNNGKGVGQVVDHFHVHILSGSLLGDV